MLGLDIPIYQLAMAKRVCQHMLRMEDGHVVRWALGIEFECQRKKRRLMRTRKKLVKEESISIGFGRNGDDDDAVC